MGDVLLRSPLTIEQLEQLQSEFPVCKFKVENTNPIDWSRVEILYGDRLKLEERAAAPQLRWVHSPTPYISSIFHGDERRGADLLATNTKGENLTQTGEFIMAALLSFSKQLFYWGSLYSEATLPWEAQSPLSPWKLEGRTLLQLGLGIVGGEVARRAKLEGMRVWGVNPEPSFHPHCDRVYPPQDLPTLLRAADVVCISLPRGRHYEPWIGKEELASLRDDTILLVLGAAGAVNLSALEERIRKAPLRGLLLDTLPPDSLDKNSPLLNRPNILITPNIASHPRKEEHLSFRTFRYNLRQFFHGNYRDMRNLIKLENEMGK